MRGTNTRAPPERGPGVSPGGEGRRARGVGAAAAAAAPAGRGRSARLRRPLQPPRRARPGVRDSAVRADSRRLPLPPPGDRPRPAFRAASPVSPTLARHSGSPALLVCRHLCIFYADLSSQVMFCRLVYPRVDFVSEKVQPFGLEPPHLRTYPR